MNVFLTHATVPVHVCQTSVKTNYFRETCWCQKRPLYLDHLLLESFLLYISAMAVYARSPSAYAALKNLEIIQLPCEKQVKKKVNVNSIECAIDEQAIEREVTKYEKFLNYNSKRTSKKPWLVF